MLKSYITLILSLACATSVLAESNVSVNFSDTPLPTALKAIEQLADDDITVNFSFRKLEDYTVTTEIIDATPMEAIAQAIGFYPIKVSRNGQVITVQPLLDTDYKISGRLVNENGEGVDFATVTVVSLPDSTTITAGVSNLRGYFVLPVQAPGPMAIKANRIGYKPTAAAATVGNIGNIRIETDPKMLKTLTAYADREMISTVGAVTNIRVEDTPYSKIGTLGELLPNLPGLNLPLGAIGAYGTGGIVYYVNGREVSETTQLNMMRTDEVKSISIDKAPGAEYPADAAVVVNISTLKNPGDFIHLQGNGMAQLNDKLSLMPSVDFRMQLGKFTTALSCKYDYLRSNTSESYRRYIKQPGLQSGMNSLLSGSSKDTGPKINWSGELQLNPRNRIGIYFYFYSLKHDLSESGKLQSKERGEFDVTKAQDSESELYSGTVSYDHTGNRLTVHLAQDLAYTNPLSDINVIEKQNDATTSRFDLNNHEYFVSTTNARLGFRLSPQTLLNFGGRFSHIKSNTNKTFMDGQPGTGSYVPVEGGYGSYNKYNHMDVNENAAQGYLTLNQRIGNLMVVPGIRYEYVDRWISDNVKGENPSDGNGSDNKPTNYVYDRNYSRWLPSLMLKYSNGSFNTTLNYVSRMTQPTFSMLNSGLIYEDNFTYYNSNPVLKPTTTDEVRLSMGYRGLSADVGYKSVKNAIAEIEQPVGTTGIVYRTPINLRKYHEVDLNLAYASTIGRVGYYAGANLVIPGWNTVYYSNQKATFNFDINLTYKLNDTFSFYTDFKHIGSCRWMVYDRIDSQLWNLGANASLLHNRLNINLEATDLLNRNNTGSVSTVYNMVTSSRFVYCDTHGMRLRVSYTLFNHRIRTNVNRGNIDAIDRIEH